MVGSVPSHLVDRCPVQERLPEGKRRRAIELVDLDCAFAIAPSTFPIGHEQIAGRRERRGRPDKR